nr:hypothetical protein [Tanacetum cinerariifolium]
MQLTAMELHHTRVDVFQQEAWEKYPAMLHQAFRLSKKLEQPLLLREREGVPNYRGLAYECSKRWDADREYVFPWGYMNLFNLIRAPNPTKVKIGSRPRAAHEVPLLTVTANRVIEMEDQTAATDSSGSTGVEDQETTAPEVPPPENVPTKGGALEAGPAERVTATDPPAGEIPYCHRAGDGIHCLTPASQGTPANVSDPDPLSFVDLQSRPSADVSQSSKRAAVAGDPKYENTSFASMVGSLGSIYRPEWGITNGSMLDTPKACQDLVDHSYTSYT